jgi:hypothetical protein
MRGSRCTAHGPHTPTDEADAGLSVLRGARNHSLTSIIKIANALGVQPSEIPARAEHIQAAKAQR